jgi:hypothetical protein
MRGAKADIALLVPVLVVGGQGVQARLCLGLVKPDAREDPTPRVNPQHRGCRPLVADHLYVKPGVSRLVLVGAPRAVLWPDPRAIVRQVDHAAAIAALAQKVEVESRRLAVTLNVVDDVDLLTDELGYPDGRVIAAAKIPKGAHFHVAVARHKPNAPLASWPRRAAC